MSVKSGKQENLITLRPSQLVKLSILIYFLIIIETNSGKGLLPVHCTQSHWLLWPIADQPVNVTTKWHQKSKKRMENFAQLLKQVVINLNHWFEMRHYKLHITKLNLKNVKNWFRCVTHSLDFILSSQWTFMIWYMNLNWSLKLK